jgi:hypothetical protein
MSISDIKVIDIEIASAIDDVIQATRYLQDLAGFRASPDVSSHFISEEQWKSSRRADRVELLRGWLKAEKAYEKERASQLGRADS